MRRRGGPGGLRREGSPKEEVCEGGVDGRKGRRRARRRGRRGGQEGEGRQESGAGGNERREGGEGRESGERQEGRWEGGVGVGVGVCVVDRLLVTMDATPPLTTDDTRLYRSSVGALVYYVLDRADAQLEASILGSCLRSCESRAPIQSHWNLRVTLTATGLVTLRHESHRAVVMWNVTVVLATSSGMAEYHAMCSTAEELIHLRSILEHFGFRVNTSLRDVPDWKKSRQWR